MSSTRHAVRPVRRGGGREHHQRAIWEAKARLLERAVRPYGVLHRDALRAVSGARRWREGSFPRAVQTAVELGLLEPLPLSFYRAGGGLRR
jgi:hypothetical protein